MTGVASNAPLSTVYFQTSDSFSGSELVAMPVACALPRKTGQGVLEDGARTASLSVAVSAVEVEAELPQPAHPAKTISRILAANGREWTRMKCRRIIVRSEVVNDPFPFNSWLLKIKD